MNIAEVKYLGNLRTEAKHLRSGNKFITDAPTDNKGKGEAFSPTDLMATSLATCMLTLMGITANENNIPLESANVDVEKVMGSNPRKVDVIRLHFDVQASGISNEDQQKLADAARNCPVALSLREDLQQEVSFNFQ